MRNDGRPNRRGFGMTRRDTLGGFEELVLLAVMRLGSDSYGVTIRGEIERQTGRDISLGAIYPTLDRLEEKGLVSSRKGEPTGERGGRARRHFELTREGLAALRRSREVMEAMWEGFEADAESRP
jgi:DNA-binding PadR family transcriptional regulator